MSFNCSAVSTLLGSFSSRPKRMHFLTGPRCKVLIAGLQGTRFIPCILIQFGLRHRGLILKQRAHAKNWPPTRVQGQDVFSLTFLPVSLLPTNRLNYRIITVWSILWTKPTGWRLCMKGFCHFSDTIRQIFTRFSQQIDFFSLPCQSQNLDFFWRCVKPCHSPESSQNPPSIQLY